MIKPPPNVNCPPPLLSAEATGGTKVSFGGDNKVDTELENSAQPLQTNGSEPLPQRSRA